MVRKHMKSLLKLDKKKKSEEVGSLDGMVSSLHEVTSLWQYGDLNILIFFSYRMNHQRPKERKITNSRKEQMQNHFTQHMVWLVKGEPPMMVLLQGVFIQGWFIFLFIFLCFIPKLQTETFRKLQIRSEARG